MKRNNSFTSAFVGIALDQGYLDSLGQTLMSFFPECDTPTLDSLRRKITIRDLLTMRSGIQFDENQEYSEIFNQSANWLQQAIHLPMAFAPGQTFNYASVDAELVSGILTKSTQLSTSDLAKTFLLEPLNIHVLSWPRDPQGYFFGAGRMVFYPRDLARFGWLYVSGGSLDGGRILSSSWVTQSTQTQVPMSGTRGDFRNVGYGYFWWTAQWQSQNVFLAVGFGGQFIVGMPSKKLVIVITSNQNCTNAEADKRHLELLDVLSRRVLSAAN